MTKKMIAIVATAALAACLGLAGCGGNQAASSSAASASAASASAASTSAASASAASASAASASAPSASASAASASAASAPAASAGAAPASTTASYIGDQAAVDIALANAGLAAADVTQLKVELDLDDAVVHYDVDFKHGGMDYDYDIDATNGAILTAKSEVDD